ncbi:protein MpASHR2 [Marchantia polymorpha subsp. ruderalis]|uniref:SET domain-containing protein n=1 Tax=Marchantia polymorpha TaxID=3197 RepID=A0A2R6WK59_MARPO|nr:hypothetical protein MARPO_0082s0074 [Marchantia polymorpha]BBN02498.1 hypothetical protein Mp_2g15790 [Marchantia polymorpha subsp. ruderalis]|eukprot:PTQ34246.1 hypothetical protein MARPO_0082s0074 [Marchantia polymorpha]
MPMDSESADPLKVAALSLDERDPAEAQANGNGYHPVGNGDTATDADEDKNCGKKKKKKKKSKGKSSSDKPLPTQKIVDQFFPWTAVNKQVVGRCAIASRDIKAGELVVAEHCYAFIPRRHDRSVVCHSCCCDISPPAQSFECPGCRYAMYCKDCKGRAMEEHKQFCRVSNPISGIAKIADCDEDLLRFVFALVLKGRSHKNMSKQISNGVAVDGLSNDGTVQDGIVYPSYEDCISLKTHSEKATPAWKESVRRGCQLLYEEAVKLGAQSVDNLDITLDDLETLAALVNTNSHGMGAHGAGFHNADVAVGIFPFVSMLSHSCRPNCCFSSEGKVMYVRATQDVPKGSELCISYINLYEPRSTRKMQLAVSKHFLCRCQRCSEPFVHSVDRYLEGCMCTVRGCGGVVVKTSSMIEQDPTLAPGDSLTLHNSSSWKCDQCGRLLDPKLSTYPVDPTSLGDHPWQLVASAEAELASAMSMYRERRFKESRVLLEQYISQFTGKLHPLNVLLFDALTPLMNCCRASGDAAEGSRICRLILNSMEKVLPGVSLEQANFYFCLGEMYTQRAESAGTNVMAKHYKKLAQETFQQVRRIREICLGKPSLPSS